MSSADFDAILPPENELSDGGDLQTMPIPPDFWARIDHTGCGGRCEPWEAMVDAKGDVELHYGFGKPDGPHSTWASCYRSTLDPTGVRKILFAVDQADFFTLADSYPYHAYDASKTTSAIRMEGRTKILTRGTEMSKLESARLRTVELMLDNELNPQNIMSYGIPQNCPKSP